MGERKGIRFALMGRRARQIGLGVATACVALAGARTAGSEEPDRDWRFGPEIDPLPFFSHGYSVHVGWKPPGVPRLRFTLGAYGSRTDVSGSDNADWELTQRALEASVQYFVVPYHRGGLFAGLYLFVQRMQYTRSSCLGRRSCTG